MRSGVNAHKDGAHHHWKGPYSQTLCRGGGGDRAYRYLRDHDMRFVGTLFEGQRIYYKAGEPTKNGRPDPDGAIHGWAAGNARKNAIIDNDFVRASCGRR